MFIWLIFNLTSHVAIKNWNAAITVLELGSVTGLTPPDKESLANDSVPTSRESSASLRTTNAS